VRVLMTTNPAHGHYYPLVPLGWALRAAGHDVLIATAPAFLPVVAATGLVGQPVGRDVRPQDWPQPEIPHPDRDAELLWDAGRGWPSVAERSLDDVLALARRWRADLVVHESMEHAGPLAAGVLGVPAVAVRCVLNLPAEVDELAADQLAATAARLGQRSRPPSLVLDPVPPSLQFPAGPDDPAVTPVGYVPYAGSRTAPADLYDVPDRPRVCVTLGTMRNDRAGAVLELVTEAIAGLDVDVVVAMANLAVRPKVPAGARLLPWVPLTEILPTCAVLVSQGGLGGVLTAIRCGLPQLVLPQMGEQHRTAARIATTGAGRHLDDPERPAVRMAVEELLTEPGPVAATAALRAEMLSLPDPAAQVGLLTDLAGARRPVPIG
jgi:UDP:flavonoid glycosyltransferase YjiC (YdhE family)